MQVSVSIISAKQTSKGTCTSHITTNERLTVADTEPKRALKTTAAVGMMRWSFILMFTFISDENYDKQPQPKKQKLAHRRRDDSVGIIDSTVGNVKTQAETVFVLAQSSTRVVAEMSF
eukprot:scaffold2084_cov155-Skeletonema_menzelii.AAC.17